MGSDDAMASHEGASGAGSSAEPSESSGALRSAPVGSAKPWAPAYALDGPPDVPRSGMRERGLFTPGEWSPAVRVEAECSACGRPVLHWRRVGRRESDAVIRCNGPSGVACRRIVAELNPEEAEAVRLEARRVKRRKANKRYKKRRAERLAAEREERIEELRRVAALKAAQRLAAAEEARKARCPRPDKEVWLTLEGAEAAVKAMRDAGRPRAKDLHGYECVCGVFHVGDRTRFDGDPTAERWGSAYEEAS